MDDPHAFRLTTPAELAARERGDPVPGPHPAHPVALQGCGEEAEAAALRGLPLAAACRLVFVAPGRRA